MANFFELLINKIGYSKIGRISLSKSSKRYIRTPNIVIPINNVLLQIFDFFEQFEKHKLFIISKEKYLKESFLQEKFKNIGFFYTSNGNLNKFQEILEKKIKYFSENDVFPIIPFNIPTTTISKKFAQKEIENYLNIAKRILKKYSFLNFGLDIKIFDHPKSINQYIPIIKENENVKLLNLVDILDNSSSYRNILKNLIQIKQELDNNVVLMASGRIIPKYYPILVYLGVDLFDCSYLQYLSSESFYDSIEHLLPIYKIKYLPCSCVVCKGKLGELLEDKHSLEKIKLLCLHNIISAKNYLNKIKQYLNYEDYRAFVEKSSYDDPKIVSMLKILDREYATILRNETPIFQEIKPINCFGPISYNRPDFQEFRERTIKFFESEPWTSLIILLPCSAKKPYSESKSHKNFLKIIRKFSEFPNFQEIILTSPLGAIPRQLEDIYPVNSYDISVTGEWDDEELNIGADMLFKILNKYDRKIPIICHLEGGTLEIVKRTMPKLQHKFYFSKIHTNLTSKESLSSLENLIRNNKDLFKPKVNYVKGNYLSKTLTRKFIKILDYQFGVRSGIKVLSKKFITREDKNKTQIKLIDSESKKLIGIFKRSTGQIAITLKGAKRIKPFSNNSNIIIFDGNKINGNTLFRPGITEYSPNLIPNNYVIILDQEKKNILGLGQLIVGSNYIKNSKTGRIAKIYESD
ncbi:MAG: DUF5591 domain-containing protein [Promethearchaeota archaeon]